MRETSQHGGGHFGIAAYACPFAASQAGGDDDAGAFVELAQELENQSSPEALKGR